MTINFDKAKEAARVAKAFQIAALMVKLVKISSDKDLPKSITDPAGNEMRKLAKKLSRSSD